MRIISGKARGTKLYTLEGIDTRPTLDRVKESLFNIIQDRIEDSIILDLFSGSGAIGLEFISRGAQYAYLCDDSKYAIEIINKNIQKTHFEDKVKVLKKDFKSALQQLKEKKFDIIYLDPPYKTDFIKESLELIYIYECLDESSIIILETDEKEKVHKEINDMNLFEIIDERKYGRANLIFLKSIKQKGI